MTEVNVPRMPVMLESWRFSYAAMGFAKATSPKVATAMNKEMMRENCIVRLLSNTTDCALEDAGDKK